MIAIENGNTEVVQMLLDNGATFHGNTASLTLLVDNSEVSRLVLGTSDCHNMVDLRYPSALMIACENGHSEEVQLLLDGGAEVDLQCDDGNTALVIACKNGHCEEVQLLLDRGAKVDLQCDDGNTALLIACKNGHCEIVELLLGKGAAVNMQAGGWSALARRGIVM